MADIATSTREQTKRAGSEAAERTKDVVETGKEQAGAVVDEAKAQARTMVDETAGHLKHEAETQAHRIAESLHRMSDELDALVQGRPEEAGMARDRAEQLRSKLDDMASRIEARGFEGAVDDLTRFARRRPGAFLAGAAAAGFVVGRLFRSGQAEQAEQAGQAGQSLPQPPQPQVEQQVAQQGQVGTAVTATVPETIDLREEEVPRG